jgi:hypothetical protein
MQSVLQRLHYTVVQISPFPAPPATVCFPNRPFANQLRPTIALGTGRVSKVSSHNSAARQKVILSSLIRHVNEGLQTNQDIRRRHYHPITSKKEEASTYKVIFRGSLSPGLRL